jgi:hypothetical protein
VIELFDNYQTHQLYVRQIYANAVTELLQLVERRDEPRYMQPSNDKNALLSGCLMTVMFAVGLVIALMARALCIFE